jgi:hypothetical protein
MYSALLCAHFQAPLFAKFSFNATIVGSEGPLGLGTDKPFAAKFLLNGQVKAFLQDNPSVLYKP